MIIGIVSVENRNILEDLNCMNKVMLLFVLRGH